MLLLQQKFVIMGNDETSAPRWWPNHNSKAPQTKTCKHPPPLNPETWLARVLGVTLPLDCHLASTTGW